MSQENLLVGKESQSFFDIILAKRLATPKSGEFNE